MEEIRVTVEAKQVSVRSATQFLGSLVLMRDGIALLVDDKVDEFAAKVSNEFPDVFLAANDVISLLKALGEILVDDHNWPVLPGSQNTLITESLLNRSTDERGLQFVALTRSSLDGVFEDVFDKIGKLLRDLLQTSVSIVDEGEGLEMKNGLRTILAESGKSRETQLAAAGMVMLGAEKLKKSLAAMGATDVKVQ